VIRRNYGRWITRRLQAFAVFLMPTSLYGLVVDQDRERWIPAIICAVGVAVFGTLKIVQLVTSPEGRRKEDDGASTGTD
jgi:hypothetical protein